LNARLAQLFEQLRTSYWFLPTVMTLASVLLFVVTSWLDYRSDASWLEAIPWLTASEPAGARAVLSVIASSMIGVAGVTFSITIAVVSFASGNFGPRILTNFMRDKGNQITLGTFVATFIYCLMALRLVRDVNPELSESQKAAFVPQITLVVALFLTFASLAVLIYFLHHVPESIRVSTVVAKIGKSLEKRVDEIFPSVLGESSSVPEEPVRSQPGSPLLSVESGYIQYLDDPTLMTKACELDLVIWLEARPGDFIYVGQRLGIVEGPGDLDDDVSHDLLSAFGIGRHRTQNQDFLFLVDELVEIAARALSPGINDPTTAISCIDWLGNALVEISRREPPSSCRRDRQGAIRIVAPTIEFREMVGRVFEQLRPYVSADLNATLRALDVLARAACLVERDSDRRSLSVAARDLVRSSASHHLLAADRRALSSGLAEVRRCLKPGAANFERRWDKPVGLTAHA
jgi:uncharacterized membrane protein